MTGLFFLVVVVFAVYLAIRFTSSAGGWMSSKRFRSYRTLANRYHGKYESRGLSDPPTVSFSYNGSNVRVGLAPQVPGQALGHRTRVVARFRQGLPFRLELAPVSRPAPNQAPKGTRAVRVGEPGFDRGFYVHANDAEMARSFLSESVREAVVKLQGLSMPSGMLVSVNPERMLVQVDRNLASQADSLLFAVHQALIVHDGLQSGVASRIGQGIAIVEAGPAHLEDSGPPVCKVCGEAIVEPGVICTTCRTPHHRDCWEFIGSCSIYGCNGKFSQPA